ncbi:DUF3846 domain-containing protein [Cryobacterium sp. PH31-L1]|uniref:DUF3846 domain-containing protein n=1 Tax=Cryobacterium sp. PH31-L1 TaxID=3046199 RepID=UPI0024B91B01|nr:DUF3846 domain-containing protein [Cryobacterium sp. PH31-L1]MDJ0379085.1 DUF3846 domain-containing protein [Cryobacterium sp. PH31-L1]
MTSTANTTEGLHGLRITLDEMESICVDRMHTVTSLQQSIACDTFDVVRLDHDIDLFVDDEGAINGSPLNLALTIIAHALGTPAVLFGNAIALGCDPNTGDSLSLTAEQVVRLTAAIASKPSPELIDRLAESLAPLPEIVELLRSL